MAKIKIIGKAFTKQRAIEILRKHFKREDIVEKYDDSNNVYFGTILHKKTLGVLDKKTNNVEVLEDTDKYIVKNIGLKPPKIVETYQRSVFGSKYKYINFNNQKYYLNKPNNVFPFKIVSFNRDSNGEIIGVVFEALPIKNIKRTW